MYEYGLELDFLQFIQRCNIFLTKLSPLDIQEQQRISAKFVTHPSALYRYEHPKPKAL